MTIRELLEQATTRCAQAHVPNPRVDAEWLLTHCLNCRRSDLLLNGAQPVSATVCARYEQMIARRETREPLQYILGSQDFYGRPFRVTRAVLIPRPETEQLIEHVLRLLPTELPAAVLDIGTGSGCIAITIALEHPQSSIVAVDADVEALRVAKQNVEAHGVPDRIRLLAHEFFPASEHAGPFDLIISNPPYCTEAEWTTLQPEVRDFEPRSALVAGENGLACLTRIVQDAPEYLRGGGHLALECGQGQAPSVVEWCTRVGAYATPQVFHDLHGVARFVIACVRSR